MFLKSKQEIGATLKELRQSSGYTQKELGLKLDTTQQTVARWERGDAQPDVDTFFHLCDIFGVKDILGTFGFQTPPRLEKLPTLAEKIELLDAVDQAKVEAYTDGLLDQEKYKRASSAG